MVIVDGQASVRKQRAELNYWMLAWSTIQFSSFCRAEG